MKIRYKLFLESKKIEKKEITSETFSTVWVECTTKKGKGSYSERKKTTAYAYFDTFEEAKEAGLQLLLEKRTEIELHYTTLNNLKEEEI